jgi:hypothetical protein
MSSTDEGTDTVFCISCGTELDADTEFCPECGSNQSPESLNSGTEAATNDGFTSWAIGFKPGHTLRNVVVGLAYLLFYVVGIPLLIYAYLVENPGKGKYFAWAAGGLLMLAGLGTLVEGTMPAIAAGLIVIAIGLAFLPMVRRKLGVGSPPGIDEHNSARRNVLIGVGYGFAGFVASGATMGALVPETETDSSQDEAGTTSESGSSSASSSESTSGSSSGGSDSLEAQYPNYYAIDESNEIVLRDVEANADEFSVTIEGEAINASDRDYSYVQLGFGLYDSTGAKVGDALANTSGLAAGQRWRFEAVGTNSNNPDTFQLEDVTAY